MGKIRIALDTKTGNVKTLDICGHGQNCVLVSKELEAALGRAKEETRQVTDQYYAEAELEVTQEVENGQD